MNEQTLQSQWTCPLPAGLSLAAASIGQLIIPVYDVKSAGGHSNVLLCLSWKLTSCVCVQSINLIPLKLSQSEIMFWFMHVRVWVGKREREKDKRENNKVRVGVYEHAAARRVQNVLVSMSECVHMCVYVRQMTQASSHPSKQSSEVLTSQPHCNI